ncbi:MAG: efflux RND transporter periplasmic adaptor subunit [Symploca sp. SIO2E6]|nr:efflux RND transporter periplasmic adaptor subunit [Symploca sp. SIO2E6]
MPSFKDPNSRVYSSSFGYPARQRAKGQPIVVETALAQITPLEDNLAAPGEAIPLAEIEINPQIKGIVAEVYVTEGEQIQKGQSLVKIEPSDYEARVNLARNNLEIAQSQLQLWKDYAQERLQALKKQGRLTFAQTQLQQAEQANVEQQIDNGLLIVTNRQLQLETALGDLEKTEISAPTDGLVSRVNINIGELVYPGNRYPLITISRNVNFKAYVDQVRLNALQVGDRATVHLTAYPGQTFSGKVIKINPTVETTANRRYKRGINQQYTYAVWIDLANLDVPPGVQGYAQFNLTKTSLTIPEGSVTHLSAGQGMVMVLDSDHAVVKQVQLGRKFHTQRQVLAGLEVGEQVVLHPRAINPGDLLLSAAGV